MFDFSFYHIVSSRTRFGSSFLFFQNGFWFFFLSHNVILNAALLRTHLLRRMIQDLTFFFKRCLIFFITSLFLHFHKNYYHITKGKEPAQSPKAAVSCEDFFSRVEIYSGVTPARLYRSRLDAAVQSSVALLGVIRCFLGHGLGHCPKNPPTSEKTLKEMAASSFLSA